MTPTGVSGRAIRPLIVVAVTATILMAFAAQPAAAHETREVDRFTFVVGFGQEPAYSGIPNSVSLAISETDSEEPYVDLTDTLDVDITFGDETTTMTMRPAFRVGAYGTPGQYTADFVPSRPGQWEFRFHGTIDDVEIDETFTSGPDTFNDVEDISEASFPVQDPTNGELAERLEREVERLNERIDALEGGSAAAADGAAQDAEPAAAVESSDGLARTLGVAALVLGVVALGAVAVRRRA